MTLLFGRRTKSELNIKDRNIKIYAYLIITFWARCNNRLANCSSFTDMKINRSTSIRHTPSATECILSSSPLLDSKSSSLLR
jgi:hypothetical protein